MQMMEMDPRGAVQRREKEKNKRKLNSLFKIHFN